MNWIITKGDEKHEFPADGEALLFVTLEDTDINWGFRKQEGWTPHDYSYSLAHDAEIYAYCVVTRPPGHDDAIAAHNEYIDLCAHCGCEEGEYLIDGSNDAKLCEDCYNELEEVHDPTMADAAIGNV